MFLGRPTIGCAVPATWIVVPCYNEAARLNAGAFERLAQEPGMRLLFVDDGSTDATAHLLGDLAARQQTIAVRTLPRNQGKGEAVRQGLLQAMAQAPDAVGFIDADLSTPPPEVLRLAALLLQRPQVSVLLGSRVQLLGTEIERHWYRHYFGRVFASAASLVLRLPVYDTQCGAKFFRPTPALRAALAEPFGSRWIFDVELIGRLLAGAPGAPPIARSAFLEVPLQVWRDIRGSKVSMLDLPAVGFQLAGIALALRRWKRRAGQPAP